MSGWTYDSGQFNLYCDVCKKKIKASDAKHRWDGLIVCSDDWEQRHPQDFVKAKIDKISVPFSRPTEQIDYDLTYGMFDAVNISESLAIFITTLKNITDTVTITESVVHGRTTPVLDPVGFSDTFVATLTANRALSDTATFTESGYLYMYDYTTPAPPDASKYFSEEYVGLLKSFT